MPASAATWSSGEPRRDVTTWSLQPEPAPCGTYAEERDPTDASTDIVRLAVQHTRSTLRVVVGFRDLDATSEHSTEIFLRSSAGDYELTIDRSRGERKPFSDLTEMPDYDALQDDANECGVFSFGSTPERCRGLRVEVEPARDRVVARVPRSCLGRPRWVRVGASASTWLGHGTEVAASSDRWQPVGVKDSTRIDGPYGPRVRVG